MPSNGSSSSGSVSLQLNNIKIKVQSKYQRGVLISKTSERPLTSEVHVEPVVEVAGDDTFMILLLTVGCLLIVVSGLMLANTWVTRKHLNMNINDHDAIRLMRARERLRQQQ